MECTHIVRMVDTHLDVSQATLLRLLVVHSAGANTIDVRSLPLQAPNLVVFTSFAPIALHHANIMVQCTNLRRLTAPIFDLQTQNALALLVMLREVTLLVPPGQFHALRLAATVEAMTRPRHRLWPFLSLLRIECTWTAATGCALTQQMMMPGTGAQVSQVGTVLVDTICVHANSGTAEAPGRRGALRAQVKVQDDADEEYHAFVREMAERAEGKDARNGSGHKCSSYLQFVPASEWKLV